MEYSRPEDEPEILLRLNTETISRTGIPGKSLDSLIPSEKIEQAERDQIYRDELMGNGEFPIFDSNC